MRVMPARAQPQGHAPAQRSVRTKTYLPPVEGLVTNQALAGQSTRSATVLDNFRVTSRTIRPRGGSNWRVGTPSAAAVTALFEYTKAGSEAYFVATATTVSTFTDATADETVLTGAITGQTSGHYSTVENTTSGGSYLTIVNGDDSAQIYDGTSWAAITAVSSPIAITGVATADLIAVWLYRSRQFFIETGTLSVWYLSTNAVGGAATEFPMSSVFNKGGTLLFGSTLSSDSGAGLDDRCVFVTDQGEVAVYNGGDPSAAATWSLDGVYYVGKPLGPHAYAKISGDLLIATEAGLITLSSAMRSDAAQLSASALSRPIETDWQAESGAASANWHVTVWSENNEIYVSPYPTPTPTPFCWVMNLTNGAWSRFTGWQITAISTLGNGLHFGGSSGRVFEGDVGGTDNGSSFVCRSALAFDEMDAPGAHKVVGGIRAFWTFVFPINPQHSMSADYIAAWPPAPPVADAIVSGGGALWDVALWDVGLWADPGETVATDRLTKWQVVGRQGRAFSLQIQLTSGATYKLNTELIACDVAYTGGEVFA